MGFKVWVV